MFVGAESSAELSLPAGADLTPVRRALSHLQGAVTMVGLTDNHMARPRLSPLAAIPDCLARGLRPMVHLTCRDRNLLGLRQQVAGAAAMGAGGILVVRGDRSVPAVDAGIRVADVLRGIPEWSQPHRLLRGAVVSPFADRRHELRLLERKAEAGVDFIQTQMTFDVAGLDLFLKEAEGVLPEGVAIFASVGVVRSQRSLDFIRSSIPDCPVPEQLAERISRGEGVAVARELAGEIGRHPRLYLHVISLGAEHHVAEIAEGYREQRNPQLADGGEQSEVPPKADRIAS